MPLRNPYSIGSFKFPKPQLFELRPGGLTAVGPLWSWLSVYPIKHSESILMNNLNHILFGCLCSDVGCTPRTIMSPELLGSLKNEMLAAAERGDENLRLFGEKLKDHFVFEQTWDLSEPICFRDAYQILSFTLKVRQDYNDTQEKQFVEKFLDCEKETKGWKPPQFFEKNYDVFRLACCIGRRLCSTLDLSPTNVGKRVRHGPGATYTRVIGSDKNWFRTSFRCLDRCYGSDFHYANSLRLIDCFNYSFGGLSPQRSKETIGCLDMKPEDHISASLTLVPKDYRGPRGVFINPHEALFVQLGQMEAMHDWISTSGYSSAIRPHTQEHSKEWSHVGSTAKWFATLDLKDASDRVPLSLVRYLFGKENFFYLASTRPVFVDLPHNGGTKKHKLSMFAPMGSATCFPVLGLVCATVTCAAILKQDGITHPRQLSDELIAQAMRKERVTGDDIAVHAPYYQSVVAALEVCNLKVNIGKSFVSGFFRESCGCDAFKGVDVTPVRQRLPLESSDVDHFAKSVALHNQLFNRGCSRAASFVRFVIEKRYGAIPLTTNCSIMPNALMADGRSVVRFNLLNCKPRWSDLEHCVLVRSYGISEVKFPESLDRRCDLNVALFPNSEHESSSDGLPFFEETFAQEGSRLTNDFFNEVFEELGWTMTSTRRKFAPVWVKCEALTGLACAELSLRALGCSR